MNILKRLFIAGCFVFASMTLFAQNPPHPNGGSAPGSGNTPVGGGAPVDGGLTVMLMAGIAYAGRKYFKAFK
ncbi:MAG: hypothetical protein Kow00127_11240 [Bacteroidales bacterium]